MALVKKIASDNTTHFKFERKGQSIKGYYVGSETFTGGFGPTQKHVFQTEQGLVSVINKTHIPQLLNGIDQGVYVELAYVSDKPMKGRAPMKMFELSYDNDDRLSASEIGAASIDSNTEDSVDYAEADAAQEEEFQVAPAPVSKAPPAAVNPAAKARAQALLAGRSKA